MTEAADRVESKVPLAGQPPVRPAKRAAPNRIAEPDWVDWCDADR